MRGLRACGGSRRANGRLPGHAGGRGPANPQIGGLHTRPPHNRLPGPGAQRRTAEPGAQNLQIRRLRTGPPRGTRDRSSPEHAARENPVRETLKYGGCVRGLPENGTRDPKAPLGRTGRENRCAQTFKYEGRVRGLPHNRTRNGRPTRAGPDAAKRCARNHQIGGAHSWVPAPQGAKRAERRDHTRAPARGAANVRPAWRVRAWKNTNTRSAIARKPSRPRRGQGAMDRNSRSTQTVL